jgi:hypothetical protein
MVRPLMRTLFDERFAPITSSPGYLKLPLERAIDALVGWRRGLGVSVSVFETRGSLSETIRSLEPLVGGVYPRELLVEVSDGWTAYFDCGIRGTDAVPVIGHLTRRAACEGLAIAAIPHTAVSIGATTGRRGSVQFQMFGPVQTDFLNYVRTVAVDHDGQKWVFTTQGKEQPFEEPEAYQSGLVRSRFTSEMLERYCLALGLKAFDATAYGPRAALVVSDLSVPARALVKSLDEAQAWLGIVPGVAERIPG